MDVTECDLLKRPLRKTTQLQRLLGALARHVLNIELTEVRSAFVCQPIGGRFSLATVRGVVHVEEDGYAANVLHLNTIDVHVLHDAASTAGALEPQPVVSAL